VNVSLQILCIYAKTLVNIWVLSYLGFLKFPVQVVSGLLRLC